MNIGDWRGHDLLYFSEGHELRVLDASGVWRTIPGGTLSAGDLEGSGGWLLELRSEADVLGVVRFEVREEQFGGRHQLYVELTAATPNIALWAHFRTHLVVDDRVAYSLWLEVGVPLWEVSVHGQEPVDLIGTLPDEVPIARAERAAFAVLDDLSGSPTRVARLSDGSTHPLPSPTPADTVGSYAELGPNQLARIAMLGVAADLIDLVAIGRDLASDGEFFTTTPLSAMTAAELMTLEESLRQQARTLYVADILNAIIESNQRERARLQDRDAAAIELRRCDAFTLIALASFRVGHESVAQMLTRMVQEPHAIETLDGWTVASTASTVWLDYVNRLSGLDNASVVVPDTQLEADSEPLADIDALIDALSDPAAIGLDDVIGLLRDGPTSWDEQVVELSDPLLQLRNERPDIRIIAPYPDAPSPSIVSENEMPPLHTAPFIRHGVLPYKGTGLGCYSPRHLPEYRSFQEYDPVRLLSPRVVAVALQQLHAHDDCAVFANRTQVELERQRFLEEFDAGAASAPTQFVEEFLGLSSSGASIVGVNIPTEKQLRCADDWLKAVVQRFVDPTDIDWATFNSPHRTFSAVVGSSSWEPENVASERKSLLDKAAPGTSRHHLHTDADWSEPGFLNTELRFGTTYFLQFQLFEQLAWHFGVVRCFTKTPFRIEVVPAPRARCLRGYLEERWHWSYWPAADALVTVALRYGVDLDEKLNHEWGPSGYEVSREFWRHYVHNVERTVAPRPSLKARSS